MALTSLTAFEQLALSGEYNLADGHAQHTAHYTANIMGAEATLLSTLAGGIVNDKFKNDIIEVFFELAGQSAHNIRAWLFQSASQAIDATSHILRSVARKTYIVEPTFDNIPDIFCRNSLPFGFWKANAEERLSYDRSPVGSFSDELAYENVDSIFQSVPPKAALFLVIPNNPTGREMSREQFQRLCETCFSRQIILVCDFCFRFYSKTLCNWDQYEVAENSGVDYIFIEDTGKTFPLQDVKIGLLTCSKKLEYHCNRVHQDAVLTIAPLIMSVVRHALHSAKSNGMESLLSPIDINRKLLRKSLQEADLTIPNPSSTLPVEWVCAKTSGAATDILNLARSRGVHMLPGQLFYWYHPSKGQKYFRIALSRPSAYFSKALEILELSLSKSAS